MIDGYISMQYYIYSKRWKDGKDCTIQAQNASPGASSNITR